MLKPIGQDTSLVSALFKINEQVSFKGIDISIVGLNTATAALPENLGRIVYRKRGKTIVDCDMQALIVYAKKKLGYWIQQSVASQHLIMSIYLPCWFGQANSAPDNVQLVSKEDNAEIQLIYTPTIATSVASWTVSAALDLHDGVENYDLCIQQFNEANIPVSSFKTLSYEVENIVSIMLTDCGTAGLFDAIPPANWIGTATAAAVPTAGRAALNIGGKYADASSRQWMCWDERMNACKVLQAAATASSQINPNAIELYQASGNELVNQLNDKFTLSITTTALAGGMDPIVIVFSKKISDKVKIAQSEAAVVSKFNQQVQGKQAAGHIRTLNYLSKIPVGMR